MAAMAQAPTDTPGRLRVWLLAFGVVVTPLPLLILVPSPAAAFVGLVLVLPLLIGSTRHLVKRLEPLGRGQVAYVLFAILLLVELPCLGIGVDAMADDCAGSHCDPHFRPLAFPAVFALVPLQVAAAIAFFLSVRRPANLGPRIEAAICGALLAGVGLHLALALQFLAAVPLAVYVVPLPILTPYLTLPLLLHQLLARLRARGHDALVAAREEETSAEASYREPAPRPDERPPIVATPIHKGLLARGLARVPVLYGIHAVVMAVICRSATGGVDAFLATCGYTLSKLPTPPAADCHYLCTIAAQGSPRLVKPHRWGVRGGQPILVNRQLAVANAFEDLLHERWPRFGALARRTYDALAFPVSRWLTRRWIANIVYVVMKPAELAFLLTLLFLDLGEPERRIERMYR